MMKILFVQLPLTDHGYNYIGGNIPYAAASLTAFINNNFSPEFKAEYLPYNISNFASNKVIIDYIIKCSFDTICFCTYLWNVERNMDIAAKINEINPQLTTIFGGPEICTNSFILSEHRTFVDIFISGEGEWFYPKYFSNQDISQYLEIVYGNKIFIQPATELVSSEDLIEPYSNNYLNKMPDKSIFIELTRGCPYKCSYCFYSKNANKIRQNDFDILLNVIRNEKALLNEIYILSPTFNKIPHFEEKLDLLIEQNHNISLHTEIKADGITPELAEKIKKAGFRSLEIGIQTLTKQALKNVNRLTNTDAELEGLINLRNAGIELKIGIIPGLPGDTPANFVKTIEVLIENGFEDEIEFYPLMMLPGTGIRDEKDKFEISFQQKPPYFFLESKDFSFGDILNIKEYLEDKTGLYSAVNSIPDFINNPDSPLCRGLKIHIEDLIKISDDELLEFVNTSVFSFIIDTGQYFHSSKIVTFIKRVFSRPELFNIIFNTNTIIKENEIADTLSKYQPDDFFKRLHVYDDSGSGNKIKFYQLFTNSTNFMIADQQYYIIEPILKVTLENMNSFLQLISNQDERFSILITDDCYYEMADTISETYSDYFDKITFESETCYKDFIVRSGTEYYDYPVNFSIHTYNLN